MTRSEYHTTRRKKYAELRKNRIDSAYEYFCQLSDEEKQISEFAFARKLCKHMCISMGIARHTTTALIAEYNIEFCKNKQSVPSFGFSGRKHSAKVREAISKATIERNKARAIACKEKGINYRHFKQDADKQIEVANFSKTFNNNTRISSISADNIII
jgi:hypothetical protein